MDVLPHTWRLLVDGAMNGAKNMSRDEALASGVSAGAPAALRAYSFEPPTVTIGRFQRVPPEVDLQAGALGNVGVVRRPTGGLAILHARDFTYSVAVPASSAGVSERNTVFGMVAEAIVEALEVMGVRAQKVSHKNGSPAREDWCFESVFGVDLEWQGRKICGSAQRWWAGCILQHGSLLLEEPPEPVRSKVASMWRARSGRTPFVTVGEAAGRPVNWEQVLAAFKTGFERAMGLTLKPGRLSNKEEELAERLAADKYGSAEWLLCPEGTGHVRRL
jgi:lipoate-protein ligase A